MSDGDFTPVMDPNTEHQVWSHWTFEVASVKNVPLEDVRENARRWLKMGFRGAVGRMRVKQTLTGWTIEAQVEGVPAQEPSYIASVERSFDDFVNKGWGPLAHGTVKAKVLAGEPPGGGPWAQLVAIPPIRIDDITNNN